MPGPEQGFQESGEENTRALGIPYWPCELGQFTSPPWAAAAEETEPDAK